MVGQVLGALRRTGELENTYVVFTSDNGYLLGEHRLRGKHLPYEESIRVPLVVRGPGIPAGERRSGLVQNIDLAPTIIDVTGAQEQREMDGISLLGVAKGDEAEANRDLLVEYLESKGAFKGVRSHDGFVYVEYKDGSKELYDLNEDPYELENVADHPEYAEVQARLADRLETLRECAGSECR
jgi:N-acetylglucosamine-6-sulfatase